MAKAGKRARKSEKKTPGRKKANGNSHPKPTPEVLSDQQRQALLFNHKRKLVPLLEVEKAAKTAVAQAYELAKKEGIPKKDIKLAIILERDEGIEETKNHLEAVNRIARWMGVGKQLSLFGDSETQAQRHYEDGRRAALNDQPASSPSHLGTKDANIWLEGHSAGRTSLNETRIRGMQPLSAPVNDLMDRIAPPVEGEQIAH
jgi:hypothetical protein